MSIPQLKMTIEDGGLGITPASIANVHTKVGVCSKGLVGQLYSFSDIGAMASVLGSGPVVDAGAHSLAVAGGPLFFLVANPSSFGTNGSVTHGGPGTGTVTASAQPAQTVAIKIVLGGTTPTATFQVSVNGGAYGAVIPTTAFPYLVPGTLTQITLAGGQTYVANDVYTIATDGTISLVGSGPATSNVTYSASPLDAYSVVITMTTAGAPGTAVFTYSMDGGNSTSGQIATPSGAGKYAIPGTGVMATFAGTFTAGDTYAWATTAAGFSTSDLTTSFTTLLTNSAEWSIVHVVGTWANAAGAAAAAAICDAQMTIAETSFRYVRSMVECPTTQSDSIVAAAFSTFVSPRTCVCAGDFGAVSPANGRILQRNAAWAVSARLAAIQPGEDAAWVGRGALKNVSSLYRDEQKTEFLDAQRFTTLRTITGIPGYYITNCNTMASPGSDYGSMARARVMDAACRIVRQAEIPYLNGTVRIDPKTGFILEKDAQSFEAKVNSKLKAGIVGTGDASASSVVINRSANLLSTSNLPVTIRIVPLAYLKTITTSIGFSNPALAA